VLVARRPRSEAFRFTARADAEQLALLRQLLDRWLGARDVVATQRAELLLAVGEAAANVVEHAYGPGEPGEMRVRARIERDEVVVVVADDGRWRRRQPSGGGRGLELLRAVVDRLDIDQGADGTTVTLHRFLTGRTG
jgi:anti-sigma regulatory factor (Ser/Thr protein kinase)